MTFIRDDQADIHVSLNGQPLPGSWKEASGGILEVATEVKVRPGGMGNEVSAGGLASRTDLTVTTNMDDTWAQYVPQLESAVGSGKVVVTMAWLDPTGVPLGTKLVRTGILKTVTIPDMGAASAMAMFGIIVSCDEAAG